MSPGVSRSEVADQAVTAVMMLFEKLREDFERQRIDSIQSQYANVIADRLTDMIWSDVLRSGTPAAANSARSGGGDRIPTELRGRLLIYDRHNSGSSPGKILPPTAEGFRRFAQLALESPIYALELSEVAKNYFGYEDLYRIEVGDLLDEPRLQRIVDKRLAEFGRKARGENRGHYFELAVMSSQDELGVRYKLLLAAGLQLPTPLPARTRPEYELPRVTGPLIKPRP